MIDGPLQTRIPARRPALLAIALTLCATLLTASCGPKAAQTVSRPMPAGQLGGQGLDVVDMNNPNGPVIIPAPVQLDAAKNEWTSFCLQLTHLPKFDDRAPMGLRINALQLQTANASIPAGSYTAYQVLPMPVDCNRAGFVRHTGLPAGMKQLPRALVPLAMDNGTINLSTLRDPAHPSDPRSHPPADGGEPVLVWIDVHVPVETQPGTYEAACDLVPPADPKSDGKAPPPAPTATAVVHVKVNDFVIPDDRHLLMVSHLDWDSLQRLYPDRFEAVSPRLLNRTDARYAPAIRTIDQLVALAERNRAEVVVPRLQPTVKWPAAQPPQVDWGDFDTVVGPWMNGDAFADKTPLGYWPVPEIDHLANFDARSQRDYWSNAASHFGQRDWLTRSAVFVENPNPGRADAMASIQLSMQAARILGAHSRLRVTLPLEDDQLQWATKENPALLDPNATERLVTASPNIVFDAPAGTLPPGAAKPAHWLRTDLPGLVPYVGAGGDERDVRLWAWLAYLRQADLILWSNALPSHSSPTDQADPGELIWFYPGQWFGVDEPVPSIQLKWLRRAQQDYEYLLLASQRGMPLNALLMARLMTKQVQLRPNQDPDPTYALLCGTTDQRVWDEAQDLLARTILLRPPGQNPDEQAERALNHDTLRWQQPKERPFVIPRTTQWLWDNLANARDGGNWVTLRLGMDLYNAGDNRPDQNLLQWTGAGAGWQFRPQPVVIGALPTYWVQRFSMDARVNLAQVTAETRQPVDITFIDGFTQMKYPTKASLPVAPTDRREGGLVIDGRLGDWKSDDRCHDGPLTKMLDRPSLQHFELAPAATPCEIYTGWADENFYVAFKVGGVETENVHFTSNYAEYQFRRAWGEDLCEVLVQPVYQDNTLGPVTHLVVKQGSIWTERKLDPRLHADPWAPVEGAGVRYASHVESGNWWGEIAIPWKVVAEPNHPRPRLLRFNFVQHTAKTGESSSWAGPLDFGRDDGLMGLLFLREPNTPGM